MSCNISLSFSFLSIEIYTNINIRSKYKYNVELEKTLMKIDYISLQLSTYMKIQIYENI